VPDSPASAQSFLIPASPEAERDVVGPTPSVGSSGKPRTRRYRGLHRRAAGTTDGSQPPVATVHASVNDRQ
jgi:hypothetical protein